MNAEKIIDLQVQAYNRRDIKAFAKCHHKDVKLYTLGDTNPFCIGSENLFVRYNSIFNKSPNLHTEVLQRIVMGSTVIDHETITGRNGVETMEMIAIYEVENDLIVSARFKRK